MQQSLLSAQCLIDRQIDSLYLLRVKPIKYDTYLPQGPPVSKWLVDKGTMYIKVKMKKKIKENHIIYTDRGGPNPINIQT